MSEKQQMDAETDSAWWDVSGTFYESAETVQSGANWTGQFLTALGDQQWNQYPGNIGDIIALETPDNETADEPALERLGDKVGSGVGSVVDGVISPGVILLAVIAGVVAFSGGIL